MAKCNGEAPRRQRLFTGTGQNCFQLNSSLLWLLFDSYLLVLPVASSAPENLSELQRGVRGAQNIRKALIFQEAWKQQHDTVTTRACFYHLGDRIIGQDVFNLRPHGYHLSPSCGHFALRCSWAWHLKKNATSTMKAPGTGIVGGTPMSNGECEKYLMDHENSWGKAMNTFSNCHPLCRGIARHLHEKPIHIMTSWYPIIQNDITRHHLLDARDLDWHPLREAFSLGMVGALKRAQSPRRYRYVPWNSLRFISWPTRCDALDHVLRAAGHPCSRTVLL